MGRGTENKSARWSLEELSTLRPGQVPVSFSSPSTLPQEELNLPAEGLWRGGDGPATAGGRACSGDLMLGGGGVRGRRGGRRGDPLAAADDDEDAVEILWPLRTATRRTQTRMARGPWRRGSPARLRGPARGWPWPGRWRGSGRTRPAPGPAGLYRRRRRSRMRRRPWRRRGGQRAGRRPLRPERGRGGGHGGGERLEHAGEDEGGE